MCNYKPVVGAGDGACCDSDSKTAHEQRYYDNVSTHTW
jgi:hypothetical protein